MLRVTKEERKTLFKDSPSGRKVHEAANQFSIRSNWNLLLMATQSPAPKIVRCAFRSFDRHFILADSRLLDRPGPTLWRAHNEQQIYLTSLFSEPLGLGPALTASTLIPDLHHFSGRGGKDTIPLYRTPDTLEPNIMPGLLKILSRTYESKSPPIMHTSMVYWRNRLSRIGSTMNWKPASCATKDAAPLGRAFTLPAHLRRTLYPGR